jgi:serine/threonine-protein kinase
MMKKKIVTVSKSKPAKKYLAVGILIIFLPLLGLLVKSFPYFIKTKIIKSELTIGTIWKIEASQKLADYIEENSVPANYLDYFKGEKIKVRINGDVTLSYDEAENRIVNKQWDIAFTTSPILSIFAKEQGYSYIAGMLALLDLRGLMYNKLQI